MLLIYFGDISRLYQGHIPLSLIPIPHQNIVLLCGGMRNPVLKIWLFRKISVLGAEIIIVNVFGRGYQDFNVLGRGNADF